MYLIEYFKTDGKTVTLQCEDYNDLISVTSTLLDGINQGRIISFNVEAVKC